MPKQLDPGVNLIEVDLGQRAVWEMDIGPAGDRHALDCRSRGQPEMIGLSA
jgi:hypothetical protein